MYLTAQLEDSVQALVWCDPKGDVIWPKKAAAKRKRTPTGVVSGVFDGDGDDPAVDAMRPDSWAELTRVQGRYFRPETAEFCTDLVQLCKDIIGDYGCANTQEFGARVAITVRPIVFRMGVPHLMSI
jgi:hypothetical protein